jgi:hypothetical protein
MANAFYLFQSRENNFPSKEKEIAMLKHIVGIVVLGLVLLFAGSAFAGGYHHDPYHRSYYGHGGPSYHHGYYGRPVVVAPYAVGRPIYAPPVYRPYPCHGYRGYYAEPSGGIYIQGRNFSLGIGY